MEQINTVEIMVHNYVITVDPKLVEREGVNYVIFFKNERRVIDKVQFSFSSQYRLTMGMVGKMVKGTKGIIQINGEFI